MVAIKGSSLTEAQVSLLKRFTQDIILALDTDLAGDQAARRGIEIADAAGFSIKVVKLPQGKDPDECIKAGPSLWQKAVKGAIPIFDYFLDSALSRFGNKTAEGKKNIGDEILPILAKITNPIVQSHYLDKLANLLSVSEEVIAQAVKKIGKREEVGPSYPQTIPGPRVPREQLLEEQLLALILQSGDPQIVMLNVKSQMSNDFLTTSAVKKIFKFLEDYLPSKKFKISEFVKSLPQELVSIVDRAYLADLVKIPEDEKLFTRELNKTMAEIKKISLRRSLLSLALKIKETKKKKELGVLTAEYRKIAAELKKYQSM